MARLQLDAILRLVAVTINPTIFKKISASTASLPKNMQLFNHEISVTNNSAKNVTNTINKLSTATQKLGGTLEVGNRTATKFLQRMTQFAISLPIFVTLNRAIQGSVAFMAEFEKELTKVVRVDPGELTKKFHEIGAAVLTIAQNFGATGSEVLGSVKTFIQAGDSIEEALDKARVATLATQVSTLELVDAQELLIGVSAQFAEQGLSNIQVLDMITKAEDASASNAIDFANAFRTGGNALNFATKSFSDSIGLIAGLREQTRKSGNEIGTFFKTLSTRIFAAGDSKKAVEGLGVAVVNLDGSLRPLMPVLRDIKVAFDQLTESEQASAAKAIAGVRQFEGFLATLASLDKASEVASKSLDAEGTATERLGLVQETLSFKVKQMIAAFQKFSVVAGDSGLLDVFKKLADFASAITGALGGAVKFANDIGISLAPLLAIGAIKFGQKIFAGGAGAAGGSAQGNGAAASNIALSKLASSSNITAQAMERFHATMSTGQRVFADTKINFEGLVQKGQKYGMSIEKVAFATQGMGQQFVRVQLSQKQLASIAQQQISLEKQRTMLMAGFILAAGGVNKGLQALSMMLKEAGNDVASQFAASAGEAINTAAAFAILGPKVAGFAGLMDLAISSVSNLINFINDDLAAQQENRGFTKQQTSFNNLQKNEAGGLDKFIEILSNQLANSDGKITSEFFENVKREFAVFAKETPELMNLDINTIFSPKLLASISNSRMEFEGLRAELEATGPTTGGFLTLFRDIRPEIKEATVSMAAFADEADGLVGSLAGLQSFSKIAETEKQIATVREELNKLSQSSIALYKSESATRKEELNSLNKVLDARIFAVNRVKSAANVDPGGLGFVTSDLANEFINSVLDAFANGQGEVAKILTSTKFTPDQLAFGEELVKAMQDQQGAELDLRKAEFEVRKSLLQEEFDLQVGLKEVSNESAKNIDDLKNKMIDLGLSADASAGDLERLQGLTLDQFKEILAGTSKLPITLQKAAKAGGGDGVEKAEQEITATAAKAAVEIEALNRVLDETRTNLANLKDGFSQITGESKKDLLVKSATTIAAINQKEAESNIELAKLGIARAKAMKEAEDEATKKAEALSDALHKLATAERAVGDKTRDVARSFQDFLDSKSNDFSDQDADAQTSLKEAQKGVLDSTKDLADAYKGLNEAVLAYNDALAGGRIEANVFGSQIDQLNGTVNTFQGRLDSLNNAFTTVLRDANISLQQRIQLERQLSEETLSFLQQAQSEITGAGLGVFGQTGQENQALHEGIQGLTFIADKLGGSFQDFLSIKPGDFNKLSNELLNLPVDFRTKMLEALNTLPSTVNVGGFSVDELKTAIGQVGAGIAPEEGLPSVEELVSKQTDQLTKLQDLALQDANLQLAGVVAAQEQVNIAKAGLEEAKIAQDRAEENILSVRDAIVAENDALIAAEEKRQELTEAILSATTDASINEIQSQAQEFANQNATFREIGDQIVQAIDALAAVQSAFVAAQANIPASYAGHIPNFARGSVSAREAAGLIRAASIEKRHMPAGAGLAVANTSEAIIPTRHKGHIPNFDSGNLVSRVVSGGGINSSEANRKIIDKLTRIDEHLASISSSNDSIRGNTDPAIKRPGKEGKAAADLRIEIATSNADTVQVTGLNNLAGEVEKAVSKGKDRHVAETMKGVEEAITAMHQVLRERGAVSSFGKPS